MSLGYGATPIIWVLQWRKTILGRCQQSQCLNLSSLNPFNQWEKIFSLLLHHHQPTMSTHTQRNSNHFLVRFQRVKLTRSMSWWVVTALGQVLQLREILKKELLGAWAMVVAATSLGTVVVIHSRRILSSTRLNSSSSKVHRFSPTLILTDRYNSKFLKMLDASFLHVQWLLV
jgi:hypothetical protein